jgi:hypothetical protein
MNFTSRGCVIHYELFTLQGRGKFEGKEVNLIFKCTREILTDRR